MQTWNCQRDSTGVGGSTEGCPNPVSSRTPCQDSSEEGSLSLLKGSLCKLKERRGTYQSKSQEAGYSPTAPHQIDITIGKRRSGRPGS